LNRLYTIRTAVEAGMRIPETIEHLERTKRLKAEAKSQVSFETG
jgi:hypothetical protein